MNKINAHWLRWSLGTPLPELPYVQQTHRPFIMTAIAKIDISLIEQCCLIVSHN